MAIHKLRWREDEIEAAIEHELTSIAFPESQAQWFKKALEETFSEVGKVQATQKRILTKRRTELINMQDRLLNGYLAGSIDEATFQAKSLDLKSQLEEVERQLDQSANYDPAYGDSAMAVFEFSQNLLPRWRGSKLCHEKRELLEIVSLNRHVSDVSLCLIKRKPF